MYPSHKKYQNERRRYSRYNIIGELKIIVQENISFREQIKDVSLKGIRISHNGKYQFNLYEKFPFEITFTRGDQPQNISGVAEVIRMIPFEEVGLLISSIDETNQEKLTQLIESKNRN
ncbi:MAG: PilZ domain-containing protein [Candidatus Omnitrophica bacterium]|nr:PilZ domain-containing protein [Candidatus Omnitrophota bacterium]